MARAIGGVLVVALLCGCRSEPALRADPADAPGKAPTAAELLTTLLDLYAKLPIDKKSDVPASGDRWSGQVIRISGLASRPPDKIPAGAILLKDKPGRTLAVICVVADPDGGLPNDGETLTVEGRFEVGATHHWQLPLAYWEPVLALRDCRRIP